MRWLVYKRDDQLLGVVIVEAASLIGARMRASLDGLDANATFAEGHELDDERAARVPARDVGRMLTRKEAAALLDKIERPKRAGGKRR